jgi:hypothetical protein
MVEIDPLYDLGSKPNGNKNVGKSILDDIRNQGNYIDTREYWFKNSDGQIVVIQEHSIGHKALDSAKSESASHFNVRAWDDAWGEPSRYSAAEIQDKLRTASPPKNVPAVGHYDFGTPNF